MRVLKNKKEESPVLWLGLVLVVFTLMVIIMIESGTIKSGNSMKSQNPLFKITAQ